MFTSISWSNYLIAISVLLLIWYLVLGFQFYFLEFKQILSGEQKIKLPFLGHQKEKETTANNSSIGNSKGTSSESFETMRDVEELSEKLLQAIMESVHENFTSEKFHNYLKLLLLEYPYVKISALRENVNQFIVSECSKHPQLILTYEQVDLLWEEAI